MTRRGGLVATAAATAVAAILIWAPQVGAGTPASSARAATATPAPVTTPTYPPAASGVYTGSPAAVAQFEGWRGKRVRVVSTYLTAGTWQDIQAPAGWLAWWRSSRFARRLMVTVPMLPATPATTLQIGATGAYDRHFVRTARHLVANGMGHAIIRIGPEFNQRWSRWSAVRHPKAYARYFRHIVRAMRSVPGQTFRFTWCPSAGYAGWDPRRAYPGNRYVDIVSIDSYDSWWNHPRATPRERWHQIARVNKQGGLNFWAGFAARHGKPLGFGEWALVNRDAGMAHGGGGGDDPYYIRRMHRWIAGHDVVYESYFDKNAPDGAHLLTAARFAKAARVYRHLWG
jgi:hypothetical protein